MSEYPRRNDKGETVWACCESSIGPKCWHRMDPEERAAERARLDAVQPTRMRVQDWMRQAHDLND